VSQEAGRPVATGDFADAFVSHFQRLFARA
jgi:hypothetical protein